MKALNTLPNIGKILEEKLKHAGIESAEDLYQAGTENAFIRINSCEGNSCFSLLCAIEGAIQGIRWHDLPEDRVDELKIFHRQWLNKNK